MTPHFLALAAGLIAGLIKGNQWVFISPDHKGPRLFLERVRFYGGVG